jgi:hypothetical protein
MGVFLILLSLLSVIAGFFISFSYNEILIINRINAQLEFMDASLCSMSESPFNPNPVIFDPDLKMLNTTPKGGNK